MKNESVKATFPSENESHEIHPFRLDGPDNVQHQDSRMTEMETGESNDLLEQSNQRNYSSICHTPEEIENLKRIRREFQDLMSEELPTEVRLAVRKQTSRFQKTRITERKHMTSSEFEEVIRPIFPLIPDHEAQSLAVLATSPRSDLLGNSLLTEHWYFRLEKIAVLVARAYLRHSYPINKIRNPEKWLIREMELESNICGVMVGEWGYKGLV